ncbi:hypothetical protein BH20ACT5_BH20ACT5_03170 [soil metagenome]
MEGSPADAAERVAFASHRAGVVEVCWTGPDGMLRATAGVPLQHSGQPTLALPWSHESQAREMAAAAAVGWVLSDGRLAQRSWEPLLALGRFELTEDTTGEVFADELLGQELRKYPPSRAYADTPLLRNENWWYLPRLLLVLAPDAVVPVGARTGSEDAVLAVVDQGGGLGVDTVAVTDPGAAPRATSLSGRPALPPGEALLFGHDFSVPDLERWTWQTTTGRWDGTRLDVVARSGQRELGPAPGLRERLRRHRELERGCRAALRGR